MTRMRRTVTDSIPRGSVISVSSVFRFLARVASLQSLKGNSIDYCGLLCGFEWGCRDGYERQCRGYGFLNRDCVYGGEDTSDGLP